MVAREHMAQVKPEACREALLICAEEVKCRPMARNIIAMNDFMI